MGTAGHVYQTPWITQFILIYVIYNNCCMIIYLLKLDEGHRNQK